MPKPKKQNPPTASKAPEVHTNEEDVFDDDEPDSQLSSVHEETASLKSAKKRGCEESDGMDFAGEMQKMLDCFGNSVYVSCLHCCPRTGQLAVGFSFGSFQLWRLSVPVMEYTGRFEDDLGPVSHFAYQEPENDPRNFCYLWVSRGALPSDHQVDYNSYVTLYQLGFNKKHWHDSSGYMLEELISVGPRFEYELTTDPFNSSGKLSCGSRLVSCYTLRDPNYRVPHHTDGEESFEDGSHSPDLSLCVFVWEAGYADPKPSCYLGVFDMNRWYHAQMPYTVRPTSAVRGVCSYFAFYDLEEVMNTCDPAGLMDVHIPYSSLNKFHSLHIPAPEQHFYPTALSFDCCFLAENGLVQCKYLGTQERLLAEVQQMGPSLVLDPTEYYLRATLAALLPRTLDINTSHSQLHKREALLSMALEYGRMPFLNACISDFGSGDFTLRGCSLRFFLEWAWKKVGTIKQEMDRLCLSLYDWSGILLEKQTLQILHQYHTVLCRLVQLLTGLQNQPSTTLGHQDLEVKVQVTRLLSQHLQMVLWLYSAGFLPENSDEEVLSVGQYAFPLHTLTDIYRRRRNEIRTLHSDLKTSDVLHIDSIVVRVGEPLQNLLTKEGTSNLYPFPSFHALLNMFLLEDVSFKAKLTLTFYVLCDLYSLVEEEDQQKFSDKLQQFAQMFSMSVSLQKYVQGIWLLDHKDFKDSLAYLQDPGLNVEVESWQHTITAKAFLYQGQHRLALRYMRLVKSPLQTPEDIKLRLTVLLANGLTSEAFEYQRLCRDQLNADDLLSHLFVGSLQTKSVDQLLQLPFTEDEEHHLVNYLRTNSSISSQELLVLYYLQRSRFIEAIRLNAKIRHGTMSGVEESSGTRNCIVEGYQRVLPYVQRKLAFGTDQILQKRPGLRKEFTRPTPLSTTVNRCIGGITVTRATLLQSVLQKAKEVREDHPEQVIETEGTDPAGSRIEEVMEEPGPFVCTPLTEKFRRRVSEASEVVFSKAQHQDREFPITVDKGMASPTKQSPFRSFHANASPYRPTETIKSLKKKLTSAADLSLLHTPPVRKKTPPSKKPLCRLDTPKTPQSILKVRQKPLRRSPSPLLFVQKAKSDLVMATPPVPKTRLARMAASQGPSSPAIALTRQETPKKLRFSMPGRGETPTPTEEIDEETPPPSAEKQGLHGDDGSPMPRPPLRAMELDDSVEPDSSPRLDRRSSETMSRTDVQSHSSSSVISEMMIDSDISFNFTGAHTSQKLESVCQENRGVDVEAMEESSEDECLESSQTVGQRAELSFNRLKHKEIETSMRVYKQSLMPSKTDRMADLYYSSKVDDKAAESSEEEHKAIESSEEEHKKIESNVVQYKEIKSCEEEHEEKEFSEEEHKETEFSEEEHEETEFSEEEHKQIESSEKEHKEIEFSEEEHKQTEFSEEEHKQIEFSEEEHKQIESSEDEHNDIESSEEEEHKEIASNEEEHNEAESSEEEHKEVEAGSKGHTVEEQTEQNLEVECWEEEHKEVELSEKEDKRRDAQQTEINNLEDLQVSANLQERKDLMADSFKFKETSCTSTEEKGKETSFSVLEERVSFTSVARTGTNDKRILYEKSVLSEMDNRINFLQGEPQILVSPVVTQSEDIGIDTSTTLPSTIQKQSVISEQDASRDISLSKSKGEVMSSSGITVKVSTEYSDDITESTESSEQSETRDADEELHLQLEHEEHMVQDEPQINTHEKDVDVQDGETTPKSYGSYKVLTIDLTPVNVPVVSKEAADSSVDQNKPSSMKVESVSPEPSGRVTRSPGRKSPSRRTPARLLQDGDLSLTPRRRSLRIASKEKTPEESQKTPSKTPSKTTSRGANKTPNKRDTESFRTPPRPTRLAMPPTPPESSPASTSEETTRQSPRRGRGRPRKSELTPPRVSRSTKVRARSRSGSPPVVTSTTEDLPAGTGDDDQKQTEVVSGPLSSQSFMMSLRTERPSREPSPQFSDVSNLDDMEFTFSKPEQLQGFDGEAPQDLPGASFIFSPPMTRQRSRRISLIPGEISHNTSVSQSIDLLPPLPENARVRGPSQEQTEPVKQTPAKRARRKAKTLKSSSPLFKPSDSPINFVPESTESETVAGPSTRGMTLRMRTNKSKVPTKRKKPIMW